VPVELELATFFHTIWKEQEGTVRTATRDSEGRFQVQLFAWPTDVRKIVDHINSSVASKKDVFYAPDIYSVEALEAKKYTKDLVQGSHVICLDFDGNAPQTDDWYLSNSLPLPSLRVQSSTEDRQHVYWILDEFITDSSKMEDIRRTITYNAEADSSGWDMGQLLRVPYTSNYKYGKLDRGDAPYDVFIEESTDRVYPVDKFPFTGKDFRPLVAQSVDVDRLPDLSDVLMDNEFVYGFKELFKASVEDLKERSGALSKLAYFCAESGLSEAEMYTVLQETDKRWGKYAHRRDKHERYIDYIEMAKAKHPRALAEVNITEGADTVQAPQRGYKMAEFMSREIVINWIYDGWLPVGGYCLIVGPPNVGKTQIAIRLAEAAALGVKFLQWDFRGEPGGLRVMLYSLEMGEVPLSHFFHAMTDLEPEKLHNLWVFPLGENLMLDDKKKEQVFLNDINQVRPQLIIIDSLAQVGTKSLNDDESIRKIHETFRLIRKLADCAIVVVHHYKKAQEKVHTGDLDSMYGGMYIGAEADTVMAFLPHRDKESRKVLAIRCVFSKIRLGPWIETFGLTRTDTLNFNWTPGDPADEGSELIDTVRGLTKPDSSTFDPRQDLF
jgi:RecA-family ATPase